MKVIRVEPQGFCNGVKRAIKICKEACSVEGKTYQLGLLINNKKVNTNIEKLGLEIIYPDDLDRIDNCNLLITADGASKKIYDKLHKKNINIIDATCPIVSNVHKLIFEHSKERQILYIGNPNHPEAKYIILDHPDMIIIKDKDDIDKLDKNKPYYLTNQTTLSMLEVKDLIDYAVKTLPNLIANNQICNATTKRQEAILAVKARFIIIVGDRLSSNCTRLYELAKKNNPSSLVLFIEDVSGLKDYDLSKYDCCYITSGASTPKIITDEVVYYLENYPNIKPQSNISDLEYL